MPSRSCAPADGLPRRQRSAVTNGTQMLPGINGNSAQARRYRDLYTAFVADLGGEAAATEAERALCRQAAALTVRSEAVMADLVRGAPVDDEQMTRLMNSTARTLAALRRRAKPMKAPDLRAYLKAKAAVGE